ncbi:hypothetical protein AB205_0019660 [Aquarana catesbeiana]|uniref:Uncharacterized protein n=1 Tax=Aquarana catesbeiana TaxID=8400 RepID=A0A2G9R9V0_AQUCT|nr:hypothetical protein AB205_0019660 [Aquarana catesbeiana]
MLTRTLLTDTGIRLKLQGRFVLYNVGDIEELGMLCHKCEGLAIHLRPFVRCLQCGEYLFTVQQPTMSPRAYRVDWATGIATVEAATIAVGEQQALILPVTTESVPKGDVAITTSSRDITFISTSTTPIPVAPVPRKVGYVKASRSHGRDLPQRLPEPEMKKYMDLEKSTSGTGERSKGNISGTLCKYLPAEELRDSEIDSVSDLSGDDDLFEIMSQELLWAQGEDVASALTFSEWTALSSGRTSTCVDPHSTTKETLSKVASLLPTPVASMVCVRSTTAWSSDREDHVAAECGWAQKPVWGLPQRRGNGLGLSVLREEAGQLRRCQGTGKLVEKMTWNWIIPYGHGQRSLFTGIAVLQCVLLLRSDQPTVF